jgi:hypothetical protein
MTIFEEYHPTPRQIASHFGAKYTEDDAGITIIFPFDTPAEDQDSIIIWAQYEGYDHFYPSDDKLVISNRPTGPAGYYDPDGNGEYQPLGH